jgi:hypothetical protein
MSSARRHLIRASAGAVAALSRMGSMAGNTLSPPTKKQVCQASWRVLYEHL